MVNITEINIKTEKVFLNKMHSQLLNSMTLVSPSYM